MTIKPDFSVFEKNLKDGKSQLVWKWTSADLETPVSTYLKLCNGVKHSFLLESVEGGATLGRYSAIGFDPDLVWVYDGSQKAPLDDLRQTLKDSKIDRVDPSLPPMAASGLFGYIGYDCVRLIEDIPDNNPDELNIPESVMMRPTIMVIFDNVKNQICIVTPVRDISGNAEEIFNKAEKHIENIFQKLQKNIPQNTHKTSLKTPLKISSNMEEKEFHSMVKKAVEHIHAGDIFQTVLSQRFSIDFDLPPFALYRSLRRLNPSPFLFFIQFDGFSLVGSSPEILVRLRDGTVTVRPIAGTRKRGKDKAEDQVLAEDLLSDPKELSEHLMLIDLARNDIGRIADIDTVKVTDQFIIEYYSHVMHIVSNVQGTLKAGLDCIDALFAGFPHGTVTGAPKVSAMKIIEELEPTRRCSYAGCIGYLDANGDMDTCIALRTALIKDGKAYIQAGGGIVADSTPDFEFQESVNKAKAVIAAAEDAIENNK